ncbi:Crotonase core [Penicillium expansum]|nr:Crotonase core [Penicillium expansum]
MPPFTIQPPTPAHATLTYPAPHILLVTLNRPRDLNCINAQGHADLHAVWEWLDEEPSMRPVHKSTQKPHNHSPISPKTDAPIHLHLLNPLNPRPEWNNRTSTATASSNSTTPMPNSGFGGLARRKGKKPVICAVNGLCLGGGAEMIINSDIVIASSRAVFGLPEVKRGVVALAGALPRLVRTVGKQRAMEMALTGRMVGAVEAERWGLVNSVVDVGEGVGEEEIGRAVLGKALEVAGEIAGNSPDSVLVSREGIKLGWEGIGADEATAMLNETWVKRLYEGGEY